MADDTTALKFSTCAPIRTSRADIRSDGFPRRRNGPRYSASESGRSEEARFYPRSRRYQGSSRPPLLPPAPEWGLADPVDTGPRTANASRGRAPRFNGAPFGNSRGQLLDPAKLSDITGLNFVQLTAPGSGPKENMTMMRYFVHHHPGPKRSQ